MQGTVPAALVPEKPTTLTSSLTDGTPQTYTPTVLTTWFTTREETSSTSPHRWRRTSMDRTETRTVLKSASNSPFLSMLNIDKISVVWFHQDLKDLKGQHEFKGQDAYAV